MPSSLTFSIINGCERVGSSVRSVAPSNLQTKPQRSITPSHKPFLKRIAHTRDSVKRTRYWLSSQNPFHYWGTFSQNGILGVLGKRQATLHRQNQSLLFRQKFGNWPATVVCAMKSQPLRILTQPDSMMASLPSSWLTISVCTRRLRKRVRIVEEVALVGSRKITTPEYFPGG